MNPWEVWLLGVAAGGLAMSLVAWEVLRLGLEASRRSTTLLEAIRSVHGDLCENMRRLAEAAPAAGPLEASHMAGETAATVCVSRALAKVVKEVYPLV